VLAACCGELYKPWLLRFIKLRDGDVVCGSGRAGRSTQAQQLRWSCEECDGWAQATLHGDDDKPSMVIMVGACDALS
jgi:hypothetical protein